MVSELTYTAEIKQRVPIPPAEQSLQTVVAEHWFQVSENCLGLEGPAFDRQGNLNFVSVPGGNVLQLSPDKELKTILSDNQLGPAGIAVHKDGRLFVGAIGNEVYNAFNGASDPHTDGSIIAIDPDGGSIETIVSREQGYQVDDLVFDAAGGIYFSDFRGTSTEPIGGAYYIAPDLKTITPVLPNLSAANGIALSPDGQILWVTEYCKGLLHRVQLSGPGTAAPHGTAVVYQFTGTPDSTRVDADGNVYVFLMGQGRIMVFNPDGIAIAQILIPGREKGHFLLASNLAMKPGTNEYYIVASGFAGEGSAIFRVFGFAKALELFSDQ